MAMIWQSAKCCACRRHNFARHGSRQRREERFDVLLGELPAAFTAALEHAGGQLCLARLQLADTFLDGAWGRRGWTNLDLDLCPEETLRAALLGAWRMTAPAELRAAYADLG
ncbi:hypothetical protein OMR07_10415 [Methylobacterium organophilum]|nr:hypothetical protein [Methylobacterium organophilum]